MPGPSVVPVPAPPPVTDAVVRSRLRAQHLTRRDGGTPDAVVRRILAVQSQDLRGARLALRARTTGLTGEQVDAAFADRRLVVAWLNRGTLHLVTGEDFWWLRPLTNPQLATSNRRRLEQEGVSPEQARRGIEVVSAAVRERPTSRDDLRALLTEAGVPTQRQAFVHVLFAASLEGLLVRGPVLANGEQGFVDPVDWLGPPPSAPDPEEVLARLAVRYLAGHAPATAADLAYWAGTTLGTARRAFTAAGCTVGDDGLARLPDDADEQDVAADADDAPDVPAPVLLGPFDPVLHGWPDRSPLLRGYAGVVTDNGVFKATALVGGHVAGVWTLPAGRATLTTLEPLAGPARAALDEDARDVHRYLGLPDRPLVVTTTVPS